MTGQRAMVAMVSAILFYGTAFAAVTPDVWTAAATGNTAILRAHQDAVFDQQDPNFGITPLMAAVLADQDAAVDWLLKNGADANARSRDGGTALHAAGFLGYADIAGMLLKRGADPMMQNQQGQNVRATTLVDWPTTQSIAQSFQISLDQNEVESGRQKIRTAIQKKLKNARDLDIWTAAAVGNHKVLKNHLKSGADVNGREPNGGATLLSVAALYGHKDLVRTLLKDGADIDAQTYSGATPLIIAALFGRDKVVRELLRNGADTSIVENQGANALAVAMADMNATSTIAGMLQLTIDSEKVAAGKKKAIALLQAAH